MIGGRSTFADQDTPEIVTVRVDVVNTRSFQAIVFDPSDAINQLFDSERENPILQQFNKVSVDTQGISFDFSKVKIEIPKNPDFRVVLQLLRPEINKSLNGVSVSIFFVFIYGLGSVSSFSVS